MFPPGEKRRPHPRPAGEAFPLRSPFQIRTLPAAASSQPPRPMRRIRRPPRSPKEAERRLSSAVNSRGIKSRGKAHRPPKLRLRRLPADINPEGGATAGGMPFRFASPGRERDRSNQSESPHPAVRHRGGLCQILRMRQRVYSLTSHHPRRRVSAQATGQKPGARPVDRCGTV